MLEELDKNNRRVIHKNARKGQKLGELRKMYITFGHMLEVGSIGWKEAKIADAKRDAETLLLYLEKADRTFLYVHRNDAYRRISG